MDTYKEEKENMSQEQINEQNNIKEEVDASENDNNINTETQDNYEVKYQTLNDSHLRLMAEFDNYRKRTLKEKLELVRNGGEKVIVDILTVVDNFERALKNIETATDINALKEGVELIYQQIISILKQHGVQAIETDNADFDTEYHEAITTIPAPTEKAKGKIVDCTLKGYILNDKVIRHSKVVVGE